MKKSWQKILFFLFCSFYLEIFAAQPQSPMLTLTVVLDWFINPNHASLFIAEYEGFFAKQGLKIKYIVPTNATQGEKMVATKQADIALTYQPALIYHAASGLPIVRFATLIDRPLNCFIVLDSSVIHSMQDLKGKKIGYSSTEIDNIIFSTMLARVGLSLKDTNIINVGFNLVSALLTKKIDGFIGGMRNFEPEAIRSMGYQPRVFYPEKYGFLQYEELIFVVNKNKINDPSLVKFIHALQEGVAYLQKNPSGSWEKFITVHPELNNRLNKKSWFITLSYFASNPGKLNKKYYGELAEFMWGKGVIKHLPKLEEYAIELLSI